MSSLGGAENAANFAYPPGVGGYGSLWLPESGFHAGLQGGAKALPVPTSVLAYEKEQVQDSAALIRWPWSR
jgi:hypothetical protein